MSIPLRIHITGDTGDVDGSDLAVFAGDFGSFGLWSYNGSDWTLLTTLNAKVMDAWNNGLAAYFAGSGIWNYNGSSWDLLTTSNAQDMEGWATSLAVDLRGCPTIHDYKKNRHLKIEVG